MLGICDSTPDSARSTYTTYSYGEYIFLLCSKRQSSDGTAETSRAAVVDIRLQSLTVAVAIHTAAAETVSSPSVMPQDHTASGLCV